MHKDILPSSCHRCVVYKLNCINCNVSYIGQTGRQLRKRIAEYKRLPKNADKLSVDKHRLNLNHDFDWDNPIILQEERLYKRLIGEMLFIRKQNYGFNNHTDFEFLSEHYSSINFS